MWIYAFGERNGADIKLGRTGAACLRERLRSVNDSQTADETYVLLAGMLGPASAEVHVKEYFARWRREDKGKRTEYFLPADELVEWILWLRMQWWTCFDADTLQSEWDEQHPSFWLPDRSRRASRPTPDATKMVQDYEQFRGPLAGTAWSWLPDPLMSFQDYFTDPDIVRRAAEAMGGIDLDAASHWIANRRFHQAGVEIADYFHVNRSAFDHDWKGNVWLNPPYGENERWLARAQEMMDAGHMRQLCMISPMHAFQTKVARTMVERAAVVVLLSPTPKFHNPGAPERTGTNLPHGIFYWGDRAEEVLKAFRDLGIPCRIDLVEVAA